MVESVQQTLINIALSIIVLVQLVITSMGLHSTCDNTWAIAILKAIGIMCLAGFMLFAIAFPMLYWDRMSRERSKSEKRTVVGHIGEAISPMSNAGQVIQILLAAMFYFFFTSTGC
jgi:membrane-bound ClpP family serine protease